jgi:ribosomal protein L7Ae-like RNA K-turn-binding protein
VSRAEADLVGLLGLGLRAGRVVIGVTGVRARLQRDAVRCVVLAADASRRTRDKVERLARARGGAGGWSRGRGVGPRVGVLGGVK